MIATLEEAFVDQRERSWSRLEEMIATLVELTSELVIVTIRANTAEKDQSKLGNLKPVRVPRPGEKAKAEPEVRTISPRQFAAMMGPKTGRKVIDDAN